MAFFNFKPTWDLQHYMDSIPIIKLLFSVRLPAVIGEKIVGKQTTLNAWVKSLEGCVALHRSLQAR